MLKFIRIDIIMLVVICAIISVGIQSCLQVNSSFLSEDDVDFNVFILSDMSKVFVSSELDIKSIRYCFISSGNCEWKNLSDSKLNKDKDKNVFELPNPNKSYELHIESLALDTSSDDSKESDAVTEQDDSNKESSNDSDNTVENKNIKKRSIKLVSSRSTGGSGGKTGRYEAHYSNSSMSSTYKVVVPSSYPSKDPSGLLIYLHGDSANDYSSGWLFDPVAKYVNDLNIIAVAIKATSSGDGYFRWYRKPKLHGDYIHDLIENKLFKEYNINKDRIYFTGASGGSQFITGMIVSRYAGDYGGGAIPVCGGADIYSNGVTSGMDINITDKLKKDFKIFYYTGQRDFLYDQTVNSKRSYSNLGVKVGSETYSGTGHCDRPILEGVKKAFNFFENN